MDKITGRLTVFFMEPFWLGLFERIEDGELSASRVVFGSSEPKDYEIYDFILKKYSCLKFSPAVAAAVKEKKANPKKMQRDIKRQLASASIGTKSQQALKLQQEQKKTKRKTLSREKAEAEKQRRFDLKQQKRREKHKGH